MVYVKGTSKIRRIRYLFVLLVVVLLLGNGYTIAIRNGTQVGNPVLARAAEQSNETVYIPLIAQASPSDWTPEFSDTIFGIEMHKIEDSVGFQQIFEAQPTFTRFNHFRWADIEPVEGQRNWSAVADVEEQLRRAAGAGIQVVLIVRQTPDWAQKVEGAICGPIREDKFEAFANFMHDVVARYSGAPYYIKYWEIYNEPDVDPGLAMGVHPTDPIGCWGDQSDEYYGGGYYAEMLKTVYPKIKQADPEAQVLHGGLLMACNPLFGGCWSELSILASKFFEGVLANGGGDYFDGISFHSYDYYHVGSLGNYSSSSWGSFWNINGPSLIEKARRLRALMEAYDVSGKFLMNTETALLCGGPQDPPGSAGCESDPSSLFEITKSYYIVQSYAAALSEDLEANIWYSSTGWRNSGLLNKDLSVRPGYRTFQFMRAALGDVTPEGALSAEDLGGASNLSGYKFRKPDGRLMWVIWSRDGLPHEVPISKAPLAVWDALGEQQTLSDLNTLNVTIKPLLIEWDG